MLLRQRFFYFRFQVDFDSYGVKMKHGLQGIVNYTNAENDHVKVLTLCLTVRFWNP